MEDNRLPLAQVPVSFREKYGTRVTYSQVWRMACEGEIPVTRLNGRMFMDRDDLPRIAEVLDRRRGQRRQPVAA